MKMKWWRWACGTALGVGLLVLVTVWPARAQVPGTVSEAGVQLAAKNADTLQDLFAAMEGVKEEIREKREVLAQTLVEEQKKELEQELVGLKSRLSGLQADFEKLATGVEKDRFDKETSETIDLNQEFRELLRPVVGELKEATSKPRELEEMRGMVEVLRERREQARKAVGRLVPLRERAEGTPLGGELALLEEDWAGRLAESDSQLQALSLRIEERAAQSESIWSLFSGAVIRFCTTRGRNLLFAFLAFVVTMVVLRGGYRVMRRRGPLRRRAKASLMARVFDVSIGVASVVLATVVSFGVLYVTGDWVLLTIGLFFVLGLAWAAKNTLPAISEHLKLLLNLGPVREGERLVFEGVPWRVQRLGYYCEFVNPELTGGLLRLPLRELIGRHSRPFHEKEHWFPTSLNDWVLLGDGTFGKVVSQSPEQVVLLKMGGSRATYPAAAFLELFPENLSGNFRVQVVFGIDYVHQAEVTTTVLDVFRQRIEADLRAYAGEDGLISLNVEFKEAGASSLDFVVLADMSGALGSRYQFLKRRIQRICVDVCNEHGYGIPFTQVTVHQAG